MVVGITVKTLNDYLVPHSRRIRQSIHFVDIHSRQASGGGQLQPGSGSTSDITRFGTGYFG